MDGHEAKGSQFCSAFGLSSTIAHTASIATKSRWHYETHIYDVFLFISYVQNWHELDGILDKSANFLPPSFSIRQICFLSQYSP
jgi:hypothetical protein